MPTTERAVRPRRAARLRRASEISPPIGSEAALGPAADEREDVPDPCRGLALVGVDPRDRERQGDVLGDVEQRDEVERLEDEPGPIAAELRGRVVAEPADRLALEDHLARRRTIETAEE